MEKNKILLTIIDAIFIVAFNLYFFLFYEGSFYPSVWFSYGMIHFAYCSIIIVPLFLSKSSVATDVFRPIYIVTLTYFFIELFIGLMCICFSTENFKSPFIIQISTFLLFLFFICINLLIAEHTVSNISKQKREKQFIQTVSILLKTTLEDIEEDTLRLAIEKTYDIIRCSPSQTRKDVEFIENEIIELASNLQDAVNQKEIDIIENLNKQLIKKINERNILFKTRN